MTRAHAIALFQVHPGSIRRGIPTVPAEKAITSFKSTLVRLEVEVQPLAADTSACFKSTLVRLEVQLRTTSPTFSPCFKSTLVRLEVTNVTDSAGNT